MAKYEPVDARIAAVATAQHGAFTRAQAGAVGCSSAQVDRRVAAGAWVRLLPRVYRHAATPTSTLLFFSASVLWAGAGSALSHSSAAAVWRLDGIRVAEPEIIVPMTRAPAATGVIVHRTRAVDPRDLREVAGLPATAPARTIIDLAAVLDEPALARAIESACGRGLTTGPAVLATLDRLGTTGRPGIARLRRLLVVRSR